MTTIPTPPLKPRSKSMARNLRSIAFHAHRWLGLTAGSLLCIAGITGSILVFWPEIDRWLLARQFGEIMPTATTVPLVTIIDRVTAIYAAKGLTLNGIKFPERADLPYDLWLENATDSLFQAFVNPYTGEVLGDREWESSWVARVNGVHDQLLAGDTGTLIVGIVALLSLILSLTGIILWPGWRKVVTGLRVKWDGHPQRLNFDLHKVTGIITAIFMMLISFTGFAWNIPQAKVMDAIYAVTFTPKLVDPVSKPIAGKQPLPLTDLLQRAEAVFPTAKIEYISFPHKPEESFSVSKKQPTETGSHGNTLVALDRYTGEVIQAKDGVKLSRAEAIINQFEAVHFGTFGGIPTRILYVFVGLAPTFLAITGSVMFYWRGKRSTTKLPRHQQVERVE
jgi:uncharacterized iron-regulated membrane protein